MRTCQVHNDHVSIPAILPHFFCFLAGLPKPSTQTGVYGCLCDSVPDSIVGKPHGAMFSVAPPPPFFPPVAPFEDGGFTAFKIGNFWAVRF